MNNQLINDLMVVSLLLGGLLSLGLLAFLRKQVAPSGGLPYGRQPMLSPWERKVLPQLLRQIPPGAHLCPQVRLADLLSITVLDPGARRVALNRVAAKSVDFVVIDIASGNTLLVVELDDNSHLRPDRQARDALVNEVLRSAGIPIARFRPGQVVDVRPYLRRAAGPVSRTSVPGTGSPRRPGAAAMWRGAK